MLKKGCGPVFKLDSCRYGHGLIRASDFAAIDLNFFPAGLSILRWPPAAHSFTNLKGKAPKGYGVPGLFSLKPKSKLKRK